MALPRRTALLAVALAAASCAPKLVPGTSFPDTPDTRAVLGVIQSYALALQQKDAPGILRLVSPRYFDDGGTADASDDLDYGALAETLPKTLGQVETVRLELVVRDLAIEGDTAAAEIFSDSWYRVSTPGGPAPRRDSDIHRMRLQRVNGEWKIVSGV